jgi:hypothetical protein
MQLGMQDCFDEQRYMSVAHVAPFTQAIIRKNDAISNAAAILQPSS